MLNNARIAWIVAAVLAVILVIILFSKSSPVSVAQVRDVIERDCMATDDTSRARCSEDLRELADTLSRFSQQLGTPAE